MMTRPASLTDLSQFGQAASGSMLSTIALAWRQAFLMACCQPAQMAELPPRALRYPMGARALRLMRSDD
jgi:hypothetical protein